MEPDPSWRHRVEGGAAVYTRENQVRYDKTLSHHEYSQTALDQVVQRGWEISVMGECSLQVPVSIRLHQAVFLLPFSFLIM